VEHLLIIKGTQEQLRAIEKSLSLRVKRTPGMEMELQSFPDDDEIPASGNGVDVDSAWNNVSDQMDKNDAAKAEEAAAKLAADTEEALKADNAEAASDAIKELEDLEAANKAIEEEAAAKLASEAQVESTELKSAKTPAKLKK